ncbi:hypothetical protein ACH41E_18550 [Streptomyces sp. NPDC020412]|uniref:hypothetical protein n=1 Tax=Streptomyces sp. NPDC020412 TaxID=3365073 RepID=UPI0037B46558
MKAPGSGVVLPRWRAAVGFTAEGWDGGGLRIAITGRGTFRRFRDVLARDERAWRRYDRLSDERQRGRARVWLAEEGYCPSASYSASSR